MAEPMNPLQFAQAQSMQHFESEGEVLTRMLVPSVSTSFKLEKRPLLDKKGNLVKDVDGNQVEDYVWIGTKFKELLTIDASSSFLPPQVLYLALREAYHCNSLRTKTQQQELFVNIKGKKILLDLTMAHNHVADDYHSLLVLHKSLNGQMPNLIQTKTQVQMQKTESREWAYDEFKKQEEENQKKNGFFGKIGGMFK